MLYLGIVIFIFTTELVIKHTVETHLQEGKDRKTLHGLFLLTKYHNKDAVFNLASGYRKAVKILAVLLTLLLTIVFVCTLGQKGKRLLKLGLAFLLGGAFSNTYDRMKKGYVVDYIRINTRRERIRRIIFNLSDFFILVGAMITAIEMP
jgi:signal peptidase II